jgi:hypothetical protein
MLILNLNYIIYKSVNMSSASDRSQSRDRDRDRDRDRSRSKGRVEKHKMFVTNLDGTVKA